MCSSGRASGTTFPTKRPLFYYITDRKQLTGESLLSCICRAIAWEVDFIQIREKDLPDRELLELTAKAVALARKSRCKILVNGRADIALAAGAQGVHLPSTGLMRTDLSAWLPRSFLVGISIHSQREAVRAAAGGADYLLLGPIFPTESKKGYGPPLGLNCLRRTCSIVSVPVLGLGGIDPGTIASVLAAGAAGVAGITLFQRDIDLMFADRFKQGDSAREESPA